MERTVCFDLPTFAFDDFAELRPLCEVLEVEADVVGFRQVVQIAWVEVEQVQRRHWAD